MRAPGQLSPGGVAIPHRLGGRGRPGRGQTGTAEVRMKGMVSVSPDSCTFSYIEKRQIPSLGISVFF